MYVIYFYEEINVEFLSGGHRFTSSEGLNNLVEISYHGKKNVVEIFYSKVTQDIALGFGEELRVDVRMDWSLICGCDGGYSGSFVIGEHALTSGG